MLGINQPSSGIIYNLADPTGSSNVQYQQVQNPGAPSGSNNVQYQYSYGAQVQYQNPYITYGSRGLVNQPYTIPFGQYIQPRYGQTQFGNFPGTVHVPYTLNPLFDIIEISPQCPYDPYDQPGVPLELSPNTCSAVHRHLFLDMEPEGDAPVTSPDESEVSTPHTIEGE